LTDHIVISIYESVFNTYVGLLANDVYLFFLNKRFFTNGKNNQK